MGKSQGEERQAWAGMGCVARAKPSSLWGSFSLIKGIMEAAPRQTIRGREESVEGAQIKCTSGGRSHCMPPTTTDLCNKEFLHGQKVGAR